MKISCRRDAPNFNQNRILLLNIKEGTHDKSKCQTYIFLPKNLIIKSFNSEIYTVFYTLQILKIDQDLEFRQIFESWPSARHSSRLDLVLSLTLTIIRHCSACQARPAGKFENSTKKKIIHQCSVINSRLYNTLYILFL